MMRVSIGLMILVTCLVAADGDLKWSYPTGGVIISSAAIADDGTIYVGSWDYKLHALNPDGTLKWTFSSAGPVESSPAISARGYIYFAGGNNVYAVDTEGNHVWDYATGSWIHSSPAIGHDGTVYIGSTNGKLYAFNPDDGSVKWSYTTAGFVYSSPVVDADGNVYCAGGETFYKFNKDGNLLWSYPTGGIIWSSPAIGSSAIYIGSNDGNLYSFSASGEVQWMFSTTGEVTSAPAIGPDGKVYVASNGGSFYALNPGGFQIWSRDYSEFSGLGCTIGSDGVIYFCDGFPTNAVIALNSAGTERWSYNLDLDFSPCPALGPDGTIYAGCNDHSFYAIEGSSPGLATSSWPTFRHDRYNSGRIGEEIVSVKEEPETGLDAEMVLTTDQGNIRIAYSIPHDGTGILSIFDATGRRLTRREVNGSGKFAIQSLPCGFYFVSLNTINTRSSNKVIIDY